MPPSPWKNVLVEFLQVIKKILAQISFAQYYVDDIIIFNKNKMKHRQHVIAVLERLKEYKLKLHPNKCAFFCSMVEDLGHMFYPSGLGVI